MKVVPEGKLLRTEGAAPSVGFEFSVDIQRAPLLDGGEHLLRWVVARIEDGTSMTPGDEVNYGYWPIKFVESDVPDILEIWELGQDGTRFVPGADFAIHFWISQHAACDIVKAEFVPPSPHQLAAVTPSVLKGERTEAERYLAPEHMSGWYFTSDDWDGTAESLLVEHLYHVTEARPDLGAYVALPPGYRFREPEEQGPTYIWFDPEVMRSSLTNWQPPRPRESD